MLYKNQFQASSVVSPTHGYSEHTGRDFGTHLETLLLFVRFELFTLIFTLFALLSSVAECSKIVRLRSCKGHEVPLAVPDSTDFPTFLPCNAFAYLFNLIRLTYEFMGTINLNHL